MTKSNSCQLVDFVCVTGATGPLIGAGRRKIYHDRSDDVVAVDVRVRRCWNSIADVTRWRIQSPRSDDRFTGLIVDFYA